MAQIQETVATLIEELRKYGNRKVMVTIYMKQHFDMQFTTWLLGKLIYTGQIEIRGRDRVQMISYIIDGLNLPEKGVKKAMILSRIEANIKAILELAREMEKTAITIVAPADKIVAELDTPIFLTRYSTVTLKYDIQPLPV